MADLLIAPYLPLSEPVDVGGWRLFPILDPENEETVENEAELIPAALRHPVRRLVDAYRIADQPRVGVLIAPPEGGIGSIVDRGAVRPLARALLAGAVSGNPRFTDTEDGSLGGWSIMTAENAEVYGHPNIGGETYAIETGVLHRVLSARHAETHEPLPTVSPPVALPVPMVSNFDTEVAAGTMAVLCAEDTAGRRLLRALDWYVVALRNTEAIPLEVRVGAARSALEVLTGSGSESQKLVRAYGRLMGGDETGTESHEADEVEWAKGPVELSAEEYWLARLCELRNAIVHGDDVSDALWQHEGHHQIDHIHDQLVAAMRKWLSDTADDPLLEVPLRDRSLRRASLEFLRQHEEDEQPTS